MTEIILKKLHAKPEWLKSLKEFAKPETRKALVQILDTVIPYIALWGIMIWMLQMGISFIFVVLLTIPAGLFLVRTFIIFHDCTHNSFFPSTKANQVVGTILGILIFTPFKEWRFQHLRHHQTAGDLDRRGEGDIMTWTVNEYLNAPRLKRFYYRIYRNPFVFLIIGTIYIFIIRNRWSHKSSRKQERRSVLITNLGLLVFILAISFLFGFRAYLLIQIPAIFIAGIVGVWLFYVQHQFEDVYWVKNEEWTLFEAAMKGSSFYKLPAVLHWLTGNIGFHHIHHLRPTIPNYKLKKCFREIPEVQEVKPLTFFQSFRSMFMNLYDEEKKKMVSFRSLRYRPTPG